MSKFWKMNTELEEIEVYVITAGNGLNGGRIIDIFYPPRGSKTEALEAYKDYKLKESMVRKFNKYLWDIGLIDQENIDLNTRVLWDGVPMKVLTDIGYDLYVCKLVDVEKRLGKLRWGN